MKDKILYLECYSGISGDMTVGALLDLGASEKKLREELAKLPVEGYYIEITRKKVNGLEGCDFHVILEDRQEEQSGHSREHHSHGEHHHEHSHYGQIREMLQNSKLDPEVKKLSCQIFQIVAQAEGRVHGVEEDEVAFHEVGAVDSIVDIVAAAVCVADLQISRAVVSALWDGCGTILCQHGRIPVPVPAVTEILAASGLPFHPTQTIGEMVTPTGAAIAAALHDGKLPGEMIIKNCGIGTGKRQFEHPNILRAMLVEGL